MNIVLQLIGRIMYLVLGVALIGAMNAHAGEMQLCQDHLNETLTKDVVLDFQQVPGDGLLFQFMEYQRIYYIEGGNSDKQGVEEKGWVVKGKCLGDDKSIFYIAERPNAK